MKQYQRSFIEYVLKHNILLFGDFTLRSGVKTPYFFNFGLFNHGDALARLSSFYSQSLVDQDIECEVFFGPAYKGIPIVASMAQEHHRSTSQSIGFAYNRKEAKPHGEGGCFVGAALEGKKILIVDDVVAKGTAIREAYNLLKDIPGAEIVGVLVALDRQDPSEDGACTTAEALHRDLNIPIHAGTTFSHLLGYVDENPTMLSDQQRRIIDEYRRSVGI